MDPVGRRQGTWHIFMFMGMSMTVGNRELLHPGKNGMHSITKKETVN
jgi:hypothetical protein